MNIEKRMRKLFVWIAAALAIAFVGVGSSTVSVQAASGNVYTCVIHPCYAHPVTGVIEDSGGEASYATGQGMVEGAVYTTGILELTDSGEYYLTIRMSLMDYTSNHSFWVQNVGDSGWSSPAIGVTGNGTDSNGTTADICMQVPSENCVVRGSMYVEPMGRDVVFYLYPSDYTAGNNTDMNAAIVTAASESSSGNGSSGSSSSGSSSSGNSQRDSSSAGSTAGSGSSLQGSSGLSANNSLNADSSSDGEPDTSDDSSAPALSSSIEKAADPSTDTATDSELNDAQGLSLSTAEEATEEEAAGTSGVSDSFAMGAAVTISGLILMGAAAVIVYFFRKNWKRWGGGYDDDED